MSTPKFGNEVETVSRFLKASAKRGADQSFVNDLAGDRDGFLTKIIDEYALRFGPKLTWSRGSEAGCVHFLRLSSNPITLFDASGRLEKSGSALTSRELIELSKDRRPVWHWLKSNGIHCPIVAIGGLGPIAVIDVDPQNASKWKLTEYNWTTGEFWPGTRFAVFVPDNK